MENNIQLYMYVCTNILIDFNLNSFRKQNTEKQKKI